ncbi:MAG: TRAP transporter small permease [Rhodobiaceae bacterium]|nr:TRAP transporter small permease [Rhodobiaceae bacterium]MCC0055228.1 TRAP transporter small permease [Rhodobiaceae bacterium]
MFRAAVRFVERILTAVMAVALGLLTILVFADVVGRSVFNRPVIWAGEVVEILVAIIIATAFPLLARQHGHISVDLIPASPLARRIQNVAASLIGAAVFALFAWMMFRHAGAVARYNETTMILSLPLWIFAVVMGVLFIVCAAAFLLAAREPGEGGDDDHAETLQ